MIRHKVSPTQYGFECGLAFFCQFLFAMFWQSYHAVSYVVLLVGCSKARAQHCGNISILINSGAGVNEQRALTGAFPTLAHFLPGRGLNRTTARWNCSPISSLNALWWWFLEFITRFALHPPRLGLGIKGIVYCRLRIYISAAWQWSEWRRVGRTVCL